MKSWQLAASAFENVVLRYRCTLLQTTCLYRGTLYQLWSRLLYIFWARSYIGLYRCTISTLCIATQPRSLFATRWAKRLPPRPDNKPALLLNPLHAGSWRGYARSSWAPSTARWATRSCGSRRAPSSCCSCRITTKIKVRSFVRVFESFNVNDGFVFAFEVSELLGLF